MKFRAEIETNGKTATGIEVPPAIVDALGAGKKPKVQVTVSRYTYRSSIASMGGRFLIPVSADVREQAGVAAGDTVDVELELDTAPREVAVPADFARALAATPAAQAFFGGLSYSQQRWFVEGIESAKKPETRARRVDAAIERLGQGRGQR
jgi:Bacteriocin-protection, YdeI or OmpD-Associated/Domain of unknown function (DUF1905)